MLALIVLISIWGYNRVVMKECLKYAGVYDFVIMLSISALLDEKYRRAFSGD